MLNITRIEGGGCGISAGGSGVGVIGSYPQIRGEQDFVLGLRAGKVLSTLAILWIAGVWITLFLKILAT